MSSLCRYDLENYDRESERSKDILNPYKSVIGVILLKIERKIKYQIKIRKHHPTIFAYHQIHTFLILIILSFVFCPCWMLSSLNSYYSVTLLNEELFKFKLYIGGGLKSLHLMLLVLNDWDLMRFKAVKSNFKCAFG